MSLIIKKINGCNFGKFCHTLAMLRYTLKMFHLIGCILEQWRNFCWVWKWVWIPGITSSFMMKSSLLGDFGTLWLIGWSHTHYYFVRCPVWVIYNRAAGHAGRQPTVVSLAGPLSCSSITFLFRGLLKEWRLRLENGGVGAWKPVV